MTKSSKEVFNCKNNLFRDQAIKPIIKKPHPKIGQNITLTGCLHEEEPLT